MQKKKKNQSVKTIAVDQQAAVIVEQVLGPEKVVE